MQQENGQTTLGPLKVHRYNSVSPVYVKHVLLAGPENTAVNKEIRVSALAAYIKIGQQKCYEGNKWYVTMSTWTKIGDGGQGRDCLRR